MSINVTNIKTFLNASFSVIWWQINAQRMTIFFANIFIPGITPWSRRVVGGVATIIFPVHRVVAGVRSLLTPTLAESTTYCNSVGVSIRTIIVVVFPYFFRVYTNLYNTPTGGKIMYIFRNLTYCRRKLGNKILSSPCQHLERNTMAPEDQCRGCGTHYALN